MFNRCWRWRVLFARRSDGTITPSQWGLLQDHLAACAACRKIADADSALQSISNYHMPQLTREAASAFDDRVVSLALSGALRIAPQPSRLLRHWKRIQLQARTLPLAFMAQIGSGAVVAVTLTSFFLLSALHSHPPVSARAAQMLEHQAQDRERADAAIPMEALLQTPTPRAALLWTNPQPARHRAKTPQANEPAPIQQPPRNAPSAPKASDKAEPVHRSALSDARSFG